jgi:hypothetical protein
MLRSASARPVVAMVAALVAGAVAVPAGATTIDGVPLQPTLDGTGNMQVAYAGAAEFDTARRSGVCVLVDLGFPIGSCGNFPTNITPAAVTGSGTEGDPYQLTETWGLQNIEVTETFTYVNGDTWFDATYAIRNTAGIAQKFRTLVQGNLSHAGSTLGQGSYDATPPAALYGYNDDRGSFAGLLAGPTPWDSYEESDWASFPLMHSSLSNSVDPDLIDDWIGVAYDQYLSTGLPAGQTTSVAVEWIFGAYAGLTLSTSADALQTGQTETVTATSLAQGIPLVGVPVRYTVTGANPSSGARLTDPTGATQLSLSGANVGTDAVAVYVDANANSQFDPDSETRRHIEITWTAPAPPPAPPVLAGPTDADIAVAIQETLKQFRAALRNKPPRVLLRSPAPRANFHALAAGVLTATLKGQAARGRAARTQVLAASHMTFSAAGTKRVSLTVTKKKARRAVRRAKRLKATLTLSFARQVGGSAVSRQTSLAFGKRRQSGR